jgi:hypothetical protein
VSTEIYVQRVKVGRKNDRELLVPLESGQMQLKSREGALPKMSRARSRLVAHKSKDPS